MGDGGDLGIGLAGEVGIADEPVAVHRREAQALGDGERAGERLGGRGAIGGTGCRMPEILDRLHGDKRPHILQSIVPDFVDIGIYLRFELLINHVPGPFSRWSPPSVAAWSACAGEYNGAV